LKKAFNILIKDKYSKMQTQEFERLKELLGSNMVDTSAALNEIIKLALKQLTDKNKQ